MGLARRRGSCPGGVLMNLTCQMVFSFFLARGPVLL